jgi:hypothetical protein
LNWMYVTKRNGIYYAGLGTLRLCLIWASIAVTSCLRNDDSGVNYISGSKVFGTKFSEGFYGTHSPSYYSLMVKRGKNWEVVWRAIAGSPLFAWDDAVLFAAVTSESGDAKYLLHLNGLGTAVIDEEIRSYKLLALGDRKSDDMLEGRTRWRLVGDEIVWSATPDTPSSESIEIGIKLERLVEMARKVRAIEKKRVFKENEFFEY